MTTIDRDTLDLILYDTKKSPTAHHDKISFLDIKVEEGEPSITEVVIKYHSGGAEVYLVYGGLIYKSMEVK